MKHQRKSQVSSGGREPGFALLLAGVLATGLREWQKNDIARRVQLEAAKPLECDAIPSLCDGHLNSQATSLKNVLFTRSVVTKRRRAVSLQGLRFKVPAQCDNEIRDYK